MVERRAYLNATRTSYEGGEPSLALLEIAKTSVCAYCKQSSLIRLGGSLRLDLCQLLTLLDKRTLIYKQLDKSSAIRN